MIFFLTQKAFELSTTQAFWGYLYCFFFFIAMKFQKVSLTEPDDFLIYVKYVEKESLSDELKLRILKAHFKPDGDFIFQNLSSQMQPVVQFKLLKQLVC